MEGHRGNFTKKKRVFFLKNIFWKKNNNTSHRFFIFVDTNIVILKQNKNIHWNVFVCTRKNNSNGNFLVMFYKSLNLCSTDQLTLEVIHNCDIPFLRKSDFYKNCILIYYEIRTRWMLFEFHRMRSWFTTSSFSLRHISLIYNLPK